MIQEKDILRCEDAQVTYRWRDSKTGKPAQRSVSGVEFLRLVLQHVLPKGFRRARNLWVFASQQQAADCVAAAVGVQVVRQGAHREDPSQPN